MKVKAQSSRPKGKAKPRRTVVNPSHEELREAGMVVCAGPFRKTERGLMRAELLKLLKAGAQIRTQHRYSYSTGHQYFIFRVPAAGVESGRERLKRLIKTPPELHVNRAHGSAAMRETLQRNAHRNGSRLAREYGKRGEA